MNLSYFYKRYENVEVPVVKDTGPAASAVSFARKIRSDREKNINQWRMIAPGEKETLGIP